MRHSRFLIIALVLLIVLPACNSLNFVPVGQDPTAYYKDFFTEAELAAEMKAAGYTPADRDKLRCVTEYKEPTLLKSCEQPLGDKRIVRYWWAYETQEMRHVTIVCGETAPCLEPATTATASASSLP